MKDREWLYNKYWIEGLSLAKIGKSCGVNHGMICAWMKKYGIKRRTYSEASQGELHPFFGKHHTEVSRKKISISRKGKGKGKKLTIAHKQKISETRFERYGKYPRPSKQWLYKKYWIEELSMTDIAKLREVDSRCVNHWFKKYKIKTRTQSEAVELHYKKHPEAILKGEKNPFYGKKQPKERIERIRKKSKANWQNPEYVKKALKATEIRPTELEKAFDEMTPNIIRYVGNHAFWRTLADGRHRNPDFKVTGQDKIIELWGKHWHEKDNPRELINQYKEVGLECLVFWDYEVYNQSDQILDQVIEFISN